MIRDPKTRLWHFWSVFGCGGTCGWAGHLRHWYSTLPNSKQPTFSGRRYRPEPAAIPALDSNSQFSPAIFDEADATWYLFFMQPARMETQRKNASQSRQHHRRWSRVARAHGFWFKLGAVARALNDGSWNERLVDSGRALQVRGKRATTALALPVAREKAGHVEILRADTVRRMRAIAVWMLIPLPAAAMLLPTAQ